MINKFVTFLKPRGKQAFLGSLRFDSAILDVGCGNNSPFRTKEILPMCHYTGIDIGDYGQTKPNLADDYIVTDPGNFAAEIAKFEGRMDVVISSHNLEHCFEREKTLDALLRAVKPGGRIFIAYPSENSVDFPRRRGTLSYFDDVTHLDKPPHLETLIQSLVSNRFTIEFSSKRYRPKLLCLLGWMLEPISSAFNKVLYGTWDYYGFEAIIWAKKAPSAVG